MAYKYETLEAWLQDFAPRKIRVYGASKLHHSPLWKRLAHDWESGVEFTMRWPFLHVGQVPDQPDFARLFWIHDLEDVRRSDVVMVYAEPEDQLHGALVEAGMALAYGLRVLVCGQNKGFSTWQYHPQVFRVPNLAHARMKLAEWQFAIHTDG